ncbi:hypothetical protein GCK32_012960 [Trichostrongylus colubriformis]|uniref:Uncharacterized protein n=1 Tax=Trichostrongylus colubriformis TaxID=6319 RepID=A0AAN8FNY2_TRICO
MLYDSSRGPGDRDCILAHCCDFHCGCLYARYQCAQLYSTATPLRLLVWARRVMYSTAVLHYERVFAVLIFKQCE